MKITNDLIDESMRAKRDRFIKPLFNEFEKRWENIKSIHKTFSGEALVLAYCFTEALGNYRYGISKSKLSNHERFFKILLEYQGNKHFFVVHPDAIEELPLEKDRRTVGRNIKEEILIWLKKNYSNRNDILVQEIWKKLPNELLNTLSGSEKSKIAHLYEITWAGLYYENIRTAGIHMGYFPRTNTAQEWAEISLALEEVLPNLGKECIEKMSFPHQLPQPTSIL